MEPLSWSVHRGLGDILVAYAKPVVDLHRESLSKNLRQAVADQSRRFEAKGWESAFVANNMADIAANSVLAGGGHSGDPAWTDVALLLWDGPLSSLDETRFWRVGEERKRLVGVDWPSPQAIIALGQVGRFGVEL